MLLVVHHLVRRTLPWRLTRISAWIILAPRSETTVAKAAPRLFFCRVTLGLVLEFTGGGGEKATTENGESGSRAPRPPLSSGAPRLRAPIRLDLPRPTALLLPQAGESQRPRPIHRQTEESVGGGSRPRPRSRPRPPRPPRPPRRPPRAPRSGCGGGSGRGAAADCCVGGREGSSSPKRSRERQAEAGEPAHGGRAARRWKPRTTSTIRSCAPRCPAGPTAPGTAPSRSWLRPRRGLWTDLAGARGTRTHRPR